MLPNMKNKRLNLAVKLIFPFGKQYYIKNVRGKWGVCKNKTSVLMIIPTLCLYVMYVFIYLSIKANQIVLCDDGTY